MININNMKHITIHFIRIFLLLSVFILAVKGGYAQSLLDTLVLDFKTVDLAIEEKIARYGAENVLVVMDIDNTILTSDTDLGSDIWYQWQSDELPLKPSPEQKLTKDCLFNEAIGLLYELGTMSLTDTLLPAYISKWQSQEVTLFALTSRSPACRAATERELAKNGIDLSETELKTLDGSELFLSYKLSRELSYYNGIMMTSGMHKGEMLAHILGRSGRAFKAIIFVDDTRKNIDAVRSTYEGNSHVDVMLFYYRKIITERRRLNNDTILTPRQAEKMDQDWDTLIRMLNTLFPDRLERSDCSL
jgi:hypothetical protein